MRRKKTTPKKKIVKKKSVIRKKEIFKFKLPPKFDKKISKLADIAKEKGFITNENLLDIFPNLIKDEKFNNQVLNYLKERKVNIVNNTNYLDFSKDEEFIKSFYKGFKNDSVQSYLKSICRYKLLTYEEEREYTKRSAEGDKFARSLLIKSNLRLVVSNAKKFINRTKDLTLLDLIQEGNTGLFKAIDGFDYKKGFRLSTYATFWIRQSITRALAEKSRTVRVPVHMIETINIYRRNKKYLLQELGREATSDELSIEMEISIEKIRNIEKTNQNTSSLNATIGDDNDNSVRTIDQYTSQDQRDVSETPPPEELVSNKILKKHIDDLLNDLSPKERDIIELRFGLKDGTPYTLEEVGMKFNVTRERIRQIESKAQEKLKNNKDIFKLKEYY